MLAGTPLPPVFSVPGAGAAPFAAGHHGDPVDSILTEHFEHLIGPIALHGRDRCVRRQLSRSFQPTLMLLHSINGKRQFAMKVRLVREVESHYSLGAENRQ